MNKNREKNGFVFIETIIAIIILIVAFLTLFKMYSKIFNKLENRYSYDNLIYIYKANNVKKALENYSDFKESYLNLVNDNKLISNIGIDSEGLAFYDKKTYMEILDYLQVSNVYIIKNVGSYKKECLQNSQSELCNYIEFDNNMKDYIKSIIDNDLQYILLIETRINNDGSNCDEKCSPQYTYLEIYYVKDQEENMTSIITNPVNNASLWQSGLNGDGYRYYGTGNYNSTTTPNNFICFGTTDKTECKNNEAKYMYRIIGAFEDSEGIEHLKLIKFKQLNSNYAWHDSNSDTDWENSSLSKGLNGSYFLTNTTYDYLQNDEWLSKIENWTWSTVNVLTKENGGLNYQTITAREIYLHEMNRSNKTSSIGEWTTPIAKIGIMYVSDYLLSLGNESLNYTGSDNYGEYLTSWIFIGNNSTSALEWTITRYGNYSDYSLAYAALRINTRGYIDYRDVYDTHAIRPVFYLINDCEYNSGTGSYDDPFIMGV